MKKQADLEPEKYFSRLDEIGALLHLTPDQFRAMKDNFKRTHNLVSKTETRQSGAGVAGAGAQNRPGSRLAASPSTIPRPPVQPSGVGPSSAQAGPREDQSVAAASRPAEEQIAEAKRLSQQAGSQQAIDLAAGRADSASRAYQALLEKNGAEWEALQIAWKQWADAGRDPQTQYKLQQREEAHWKSVAKANMLAEHFQREAAKFRKTGGGR
jgi:hypothetical protein